MESNKKTGKTRNCQRQNGSELRIAKIK